jgi:sulfite exporter TauE/SafE
VFEQNQGMLVTLFVAGLVGGLTHCVGMCGPFVMAQVDGGNESEYRLRRLSGAALLPYHLGRMTTYILLGVLAALFSRQIIGAPLQQWTSFTILTYAGVIFISSALPKSKFWFHKLRRGRLVNNWGSFLGKISKPLFAKPNGFKGYGLGILLGFLPCGLIFAALMVVSTTGSPPTAALAMALFAIGTFPSLFFIGLGSQLVYRRWSGAMQMLTRGVMVFNGLSLFILAGNMIL